MLQNCNQGLALKTWSGGVPLPKIEDGKEGVEPENERGVSAKDLYGETFYRFVEDRVQPRLAIAEQELKRQLGTFERDIELFLNPVHIDSLEDINTLEVERDSRGLAHIRMSKAVSAQLQQVLPEHVVFKDGELRHEPWHNTSLSLEQRSTALGQHFSQLLNLLPG